MAPQFSHLTGRGGANAAAFGGRDIPDDDDGVRPDVGGGREGPGPGIPGKGGAGAGGHPDIPGGSKQMERFLDGSPRAGRDEDSRDGERSPFDEDDDYGDDRSDDHGDEDDELSLIHI